MHGWRDVWAGTYHDFHQGWRIRTRDRLNAGVLIEGKHAMADPRVSGLEPVVVALPLRGPELTGGLAVIDSPPLIRRAARAENERARYAAKANQTAIRVARESETKRRGSAARSAWLLSSQTTIGFATLRYWKRKKRKRSCSNRVDDRVSWNGRGLLEGRLRG